MREPQGRAPSFVALGVGRAQHRHHVLATGQPLQYPSKATQDYTIEMGLKLFGNRRPGTEKRQWDAMLRKLEREVGDAWRN